MADTNPGSLVPLGQANTGSAFVLDQNIGLQSLKVLMTENRFKDQLAARDAARRAQEDARNFAAQQKLFEKPEEFGLHYQNKGQERVDAFYNRVQQAFKANDNRPLNSVQLAELRGEQMRLVQWANATKSAETAASTLNENILKNPYYNRAEVEKDARGLFFDPATGQIKDDPTSIDWDKGFQQLTTQPKNINIGKVSDDFITSLTGKYVEKFSTNGVFDIKTVEQYKLPLQIDKNGMVEYDNSGRPILKVTPGLMNEMNKMPEFKTYLDGREKEENAKANADPDYMPKERFALAREVLDSEAYAQTIRTRNRIPVRADQDKDARKKEQAALDRLNLLDDAVLANDPVALQSLNASTYQGGKITNVRDVVDEGSEFKGGELSSVKEMYGRNPKRIKVLTVNRGMKKSEDGRNEVEDIIEVEVDPSEKGWQAKLNQALNTANYNVEPELFKKAYEHKYGRSNTGTGAVNPTAASVKNAPRAGKPAEDKPKGKPAAKKGKFDDL